MKKENAELTNKFLENQTLQTREFRIRCSPISSLIILFKDRNNNQEHILQLKDILFNMNNPAELSEIRIHTEDYYYRGRTIVKIKPAGHYEGNLYQYVTVQGIDKGDLFGFRYLEGDYPDAEITLEIFDNDWQTINTIELGKYIPSTTLSLKIASVFNKSVEDIFQLEESDWE